jgi:hypothetical protein
VNNVRQIVREIIYDTTESDFVASATHNDSEDRSSDVALYRTACNNWFLVVSSDERARTSVTPLSRDQACAWCLEQGVDPRLIRFYFEPRAFGVPPVRLDDRYLAA